MKQTAMSCCGITLRVVGEYIPYTVGPSCRRYPHITQFDWAQLLCTMSLTCFTLTRHMRQDLLTMPYMILNKLPVCCSLDGRTEQSCWLASK